VSIPQNERAARFRALHDSPGAFVIPNPWDIGSARILAGVGFQALATSSAASACTVGRKDGELTRVEALAHARLIVEATDLPVSADLEKGLVMHQKSWPRLSGVPPRWGWLAAQSRMQRATKTGPFDTGLAVERIAAAAEAAHALPFPFMLTARRP
jgi:2-methylisocitrate lyase-like PEP mutase family enzyme